MLLITERWGKKSIQTTWLHLMGWTHSRSCPSVGKEPLYQPSFF